MKINKIFYLLILLSSIGLNSCIDEFWPVVDKYENLIVVDGIISNLPGPYIIKISKSTPVDSAVFIPLYGCRVSISCDDGQTEFLNEIGVGTYVSSPEGMQGEIGKKYKLHILTLDGKEYESDYQMLKAPVLIDDVYAEVEYHNENNYDHTLAGYQFFVNTKETTIDTNYYLWRLEATFHYQSDYNIRWYYDGSLNRFSPADSLFNCWTTYTIKDIYTFSTNALQTNKLEHFPLNYVNTETRQLTKRYSLLVNQYTISKKAYQFWNAIEKQNSNQGSLYSHQPYQIQGNIKNIRDENEPILGYFTVAGVDSKRIFVGKINAPFYYSKCTINEGNYLAYQNIIYASSASYPIYVTQYGTGRAVPSQPCADCRQRNGTTIKPDFWVD